MSASQIFSRSMVSALFLISTAVFAEVEAPTPAVGYYEEFLKNRYITIDPTADGANLGKSFAIRVTLTDSLQFEAAEGMAWWVGEPDGNCIAGLFDSGSTHNWDACPALHIGDCGIVPVSEYTVASVDSDGVSPTTLVVLTSLLPADSKWWGDAVKSFNGTVWSLPQGVTNWDDLSAVLQTFLNPNSITATPTSITDIHPRVLNRIVNIDDVFFLIHAFKGDEYPFGCPDDPCWDKLVAPCP